MSAMPQTKRFTQNVPEDLYETVFQWRQSSDVPVTAHSELQEDRTHPGPQGYSFDSCLDDSDCLSTHTPRSCLDPNWLPCSNAPNCICIPGNLQVCNDCLECLDAPGETCAIYPAEAESGEGFCVSNYTVYEGILVEIGCDSFPWVTPLPPLSPSPLVGYSFGAMPSSSGEPAISFDVPVQTPDGSTPFPDFPTLVPSSLPWTPDMKPSESDTPTVSSEMPIPTANMGTNTPGVLPSASDLLTFTPDTKATTSDVPVVTVDAPFPSPLPVTEGYTFDSCILDSDCVAPRTCKNSMLAGNCSMGTDCICAETRLQYCTSCNACSAYPRETCVELISSLTVGVCVSSTLLKLGAKEIGCELLFPSVAPSEFMESSMEPTVTGETSYTDLFESASATITPLTRKVDLSSERDARSFGSWIGKFMRDANDRHGHVDHVSDTDMKGLASAVKELRMTHRLAYD